MSSPNEFEELIKKLPQEFRSICQALRSRVVELHLDFVEVIWPKQGIASYGVGPKKMSEHYVYIAPQSKHVNLGLYHGVSVSDPAGLLEGTGKKLRHVKLRTPDDASTKQVAQLIAAAIAERQAALA